MFYLYQDKKQTIEVWREQKLKVNKSFVDTFYDGWEFDKTNGKK